MAVASAMSKLLKRPMMFALALVPRARRAKACPNIFMNWKTLVLPASCKISMDSSELARAEAFLALSQIAEEDAEEERFSLAEIPLAAESPLVGGNLAEAKFRENYGVSFVGIRRGGWQLAAPTGKEILQAGDSLTIAGKSEAVKQLESQAPL